MDERSNRRFLKSPPCYPHSRAESLADAALITSANKFDPVSSKSWCSNGVGKLLIEIDSDHRTVSQRQGHGGTNAIILIFVGSEFSFPGFNWGQATIVWNTNARNRR
ncbi:hypothetical protein PTI98_004344 [Pleurotus ostreatus]|nr:hypothetical protein PTI98_004344 [Pleurotus ostreatus]